MSLLAFASCTSINDLDIKMDNLNVENKRLEKRSVTDAIDIALQAANKGEEETTRSKRIATFSYVTPIVTSTTRSALDTVLYAIDFSDNGGFALVSTDRQVEPLIALIDYGSFGSDETNENKNFQFILEKAISYASNPTSSYKLQKPIPDAPIKPWYEFSDTIYPKPKSPNLIKVKWNQMWPENQYCPNKIAGCGPVAAAQLIATLTKETTVAYTYPGHEVGAEILLFNIF